MLFCNFSIVSETHRIKTKMTATYYWMKGLFSTVYNLRKEDAKGYLQNSTFSNTSHGSINGEKFQFISKGLLQNSTRIFREGLSHSQLGEISYNIWGNNKAKIKLDNENYELEFKGILMNKWSIYKKSQLVMSYHGNSSRGKCDVYTNNEALLLAGLYIANYFWQTSISTMVAIFVPIFVIFVL